MCVLFGRGKGEATGLRVVGASIGLSRGTRSLGSRNVPGVHTEQIRFMITHSLILRGAKQNRVTGIRPSRNWFVLSVLILSLTLNAVIAGGSLSERDVKKIHQICHGLLGKQFLSQEWNDLKPYLLDPHGLDRVEVVCSGSCSGEIALRDDFRLRVIHPNFPATWPSGVRNAPVSAISLKRGSKTVFTLP